MKLEYQRSGTANLFAFFQPLANWRHLKATEHLTSEDLALCMQYLVDVLFPEATLIRLVLDNLNTHTSAALYKTFAPQEARRILDKLQFHYTPKHGSWLNMVELEFSVVWCQCLHHRIPTLEQLQHKVDAWEHDRNRCQATVNWRFTTTAAQVKFERLYPVSSLSK